MEFLGSPINFPTPCRKGSAPPKLFPFRVYGKPKIPTQARSFGFLFGLLGAIFGFSDPREIDFAPWERSGFPDPRGSDFAPGLALSLALGTIFGFFPPGMDFAPGLLISLP